MISQETRDKIRKNLTDSGIRLDNKDFKTIWVHPKHRPKRESGDVVIEIGKPLDKQEANVFGEEVIAIFKSNTYLVFTIRNGALTDYPYNYGFDEVWKAEKIDGTISSEDQAW